MTDFIQGFTIGAGIATAICSFIMGRQIAWFAREFRRMREEFQRLSQEVEDLS